MKYCIHLFLLLSIFVIQLNSQDLVYDESFLDSLPQGVRDDLEARAETRRDLEETQFRRPSSLILKPELDYLPFESVPTSDRFGINFFSMMQTSLMPINDPNFDSSYVLDFGDIIEVQLVGQKTSDAELVIRRDGSVNVPEIGKVFISGLSLENASNLISEKINASFIGVDAYVSLINVRDIQVIVAGNAYNPGPYTLNGNSSVFHALTVSGGPSEFGSFRSIKLIRNDEVVEEVDLYDTFIFGRSSFDTRLKTGDIIFIEPVLNLVSVIGGVARPATYELKTDETLNAAIAFANNLTVEADKNDINLVRVNDGKINSIKVKDVSDLNNITSADMDRLIIKKYSLRSVDIFGAVNNPGNYIMNEGEGIKDLIERAGGYTENAYPFGGVLENIRAREINELANEEIYNTFIDELSLMYASGSAVGSEIGSLAVIMDELKEMSVTGRVNAEFDLDVLTKNPERDVLLQDGDVVTIPEFLNQVYVFGEIPNQGSVRYMQGLEISDYIEMKGGYESRADKKSVFVLQPNGETYRVSKNRFINNREIEIFPGSIIFVPRKVNASMLFTQAAQAYVSILGNLGVSLASLSVLKD